MSISERVSQIDGWIWGPWLMVFLVGTGLFLTILLRFIQIRGFKHAVNVLRGKYDDPNDPGEINHFQALSAALSATIGTGNIVGVAAAILMGGPGAVFWMWITACVGMATKFASCSLAVHFRRIDKTGEAHGGPMHYIELGLGKNFKWLAILYASFTAIASFGIGNMFQVNNVAVSVRTLFFGTNAQKTFTFDLIIGIIMAILVGLVIVGGIKNIGKFASKIVPFMAIFYVGAGAIILLKNITLIPSAFGTILYCAFHTPEAIAGGLLGTVIRAGVARGLFSNEAGLGSAAMAHGAAKTKEPIREGLVAMLDPFIDTIVICSITALIIVVTDASSVCAVKGELTGKAFELGLGSVFGSKLVSFAIVLFAFSTLISWSYYGDRAADYLFGKKIVVWYRLIYCCFIVFGSVITINTVIDFCDAANGLMALPNLVALIVLSPIIAKLAKVYWDKFLVKKK